MLEGWLDCRTGPTRPAELMQDGLGSRQARPSLGEADRKPPFSSSIVFISVLAVVLSRVQLLD